MKDKKLASVIELIKDFPHLEKYFTNTNELVNTFDNLISETSRLLLTKKLVDKVLHLSEVVNKLEKRQLIK